MIEEILLPKDFEFIEVTVKLSRLLSTHYENQIIKIFTSESTSNSSYKNLHVHNNSHFNRDNRIIDSLTSDMNYCNKRLNAIIFDCCYCLNYNLEYSNGMVAIPVNDDKSNIVGVPFQIALDKNNHSILIDSHEEIVYVEKLYKGYHNEAKNADEIDKTAFYSFIKKLAQDISSWDLNSKSNIFNLDINKLPKDNREDLLKKCDLTTYNLWDTKLFFRIKVEGMPKRYSWPSKKVNNALSQAFVELGEILYKANQDVKCMVSLYSIHDMYEARYSESFSIEEFKEAINNNKVLTAYGLGCSETAPIMETFSYSDLKLSLNLFRTSAGIYIDDNGMLGLTLYDHICDKNDIGITYILNFLSDRISALIEESPETMK